MLSAKEIARKYLSPRYLEMEKFERYVDGTQYDGRVPFLQHDESAPPVLERAPCVVYGIAKTAIRDLVDFSMGENRYAWFGAGIAEDDSELDDDTGLNEDDSELLERFVNGPLHKDARLRTVFSEALKESMGSGSVALIFSMRRGKPCIEHTKAKWSTPTFDAVTREVTQLEIFYPFIRTEWNPVKREWEDVCYLYRRLITDRFDLVFVPAKAREDGRMPSFTVDSFQSMAHNLGFCPVQWFAFDKGCSTVDNYDGRPIHKTQLDEIDALNFALSMRHRAAIYTGDPQIWETGVDEDVNPAPKGGPARVTIEASAAGPDGKPMGVFSAGGPRQWGRGGFRKKGPGVVWRYPDPTSKVGVLTIPDGGLDAIAEHGEDLRQLIAEDFSVVLYNPTDVKTEAALSGKALGFLYSRQIARANDIRSQVGDDMMLPAVDMLFRLMVTSERRQQGSVRIRGWKKIFPLLQRFVRVRPATPMASTDDPAATPAPLAPGEDWAGPDLALQWGPYFELSPEEEKALIEASNAAKDTLVPHVTVLEKLRQVYEFGSAEELAEKMKEEADARATEAAERMKATGLDPSGRPVPDPKQSPPKE